MKCFKMLISAGLPWKPIVYIFIYSFCFHLLTVTGEPEPYADPALGNQGNAHRNQPTFGNPRITDQPQDDYFAKNSPATLDCKAEGDPPPNITWYRDGERVETTRDNQLSHRMLLDDGRLFFLRVIHSKNNHPDIGEYYCNATNIHGTAISRTAIIQIAVLKDDFRQEPIDTTTAVGQTVVLHCKPPRGKPDPKVIWRKDGEAVQTDTRIQIQDDGDLVISSVEKRDIGEYICSAVNNRGGERNSKPAQLRVLDIPVFKLLPKDVSNEEGKVAEFTCDAVGDEPIKINWRKEGGSISHGRARLLSDNKVLRIENLQSSDEGVYVCSAENAAGSTQATARLVVYASPSFLIRPRDQVIARGRTLTLQCVAKGNPPPTVFWSKESQENLMFPNHEPNGPYSVAEDGTFRIKAVNDSDAGIYFCEALNTRGQATAKARVQVVVHDPRPPPVIKLGPQNQTLPVGAVAMLRCQASGDPDPIIRWYKEGRPILMSDPRITKLDSGTLQISDLKQQDAGTYTCKAVSVTGETIWSAFLRVESDLSSSSVRSTAISSLPDPPTKPVVSDVTDTSVHLSWTPGTQVGPSPVSHFYVEYFGYETMEGWIVATTTVSRESYTVDNLQPNTTYIFLVRAVNKQGVGFPSLVSQPVRTLDKVIDKPGLSQKEIERRLSGNVVELMNTKSLNSSAITLSWRVLKADEILEGFQIEYRHIVDIRRLQYGKTQTVRVPVTMTTYTLTGLMSYSWYDLCVLGYSVGVETRCSSPVKVQTEQSFTPGPPEDFRVSRGSSNGVVVTWSYPSRQHQGFIVTGYKIKCISIDGTDNCSTSTDGQTYKTVIRRLRSDKEYRIQVAAVSNTRQGPWSQAYSVGTAGIVLVKDLPTVATTLNPLTKEDPIEEDLFKKPWFIGVLIGTVGVMLWLILCIFSIWLCKKKKNKKKMKEQRYYSEVPVHKGDECNRNMLYPPQYGIKDQSMARNNDLELPPELRILLPPHGKKEHDYNEDNIYKMAGDGNFPEMKTFYQKVDPVAPYATTALIQQQHLMKQRQQQQNLGDHMFRPINQGYIQHSEGSADSCQKPSLSTDSNPDHSRCTTDHNHSDHMQSPTSDSGSHTTDENGLLLKQKKKSSSKKESAPPKQPIVNWSEMLPPPPEHPPPSECGDPPHYSEISTGENRDNSRSPMSPAFSQLSACSCPNPHTQTPVSGWNMPVYSDNECARCHSEKYYDPMSYCRDPSLIKRTNSPHAQTLQHVNISDRNRSVQQNNYPSQGYDSNPPTVNYYPPQGTPSGSGHCQYSQPHRAGSEKRGGNSHSNCATPHNVDYKSNINRASHSSHSDNEAQHGPHVPVMPCFQSYKITPVTPKSEKDFRFLRDQEWGPDPAPPCHNCGHDSGMGMEEDGTCMDRACQLSRPSATADTKCINNSLYQPRPVMSSSVQYRRDCDSPTSDGADYAVVSDIEQPTEHTEGWTGQTDHNTDGSSMQSSTCSSADGTFLTEEDFASAVARAAEMSGLTVVGTTVCDPHNKAKKERRQRRQARPISPGYSTDSNYGSIDVVHKPYPKSQRKRQLVEHGKIKSSPCVEGKEPVTSHTNNNTKVYDSPYARPYIPLNISNPTSPMCPPRLSSLNSHMTPGLSPLYSHTPSPPGGSTSQFDRGAYSSFLQQTLAMPIKEDVV